MSSDDGPAAAGTITKLTPQKNDTSRASVFLDGAFAFSVHQDLILEHRLHKGRRLSLEEQRTLAQEDAALRAKAKAMRYVGRRARTEQEVRRKLREKDFEGPAIEEAVGRLKELSYLDDDAYAREYVRSRFRSKGYGPVRLRQELRRRGVDRLLIEDAMVLLGEKEVREAARAHARKRWPRLEKREDDPHRRRQKLSSYLRRRGFAYDLIRRVTDEITSDS